MTAQAFCLISFGTGGGEESFVASVAIEETMGSSARGREGEGSLFGRFEAKATAFWSSEHLFFEALPPRVFTMVTSLDREKRKKTKKQKQKQTKQNKTKEKERGK